jgi:hypothetical protein
MQVQSSATAFTLALTVGTGSTALTSTTGVSSFNDLTVVDDLHFKQPLANAGVTAHLSFSAFSAGATVVAGLGGSLSGSVISVSLPAAGQSSTFTFTVHAEDTLVTSAHAVTFYVSASKDQGATAASLCAPAVVGAHCAVPVSSLLFSF